MNTFAIFLSPETKNLDILINSRTSSILEIKTCIFHD
eukprot:UN13124